MLITSTSVLEALCMRAEALGYVAVDTEFVRTKTYVPILCTIQLALPANADTEIYTIDALAPDLDLTCVLALLSNASICKIFHSVRQDMDVLWLNQRIPIRNVFDTQIAAHLCGRPPDSSYQSLVEHVTGTSLCKAQQWTNWQQRPLSEAQLAYAREDVLHLGPLKEHLSAQLESTQRTNWVEEEAAHLMEDTMRSETPTARWLVYPITQRIARIHRLLPRCRSLFLWREAEIRRCNVPRQHLLPDACLMALVRQPPNTIADLLKLLRAEDGPHRGWAPQPWYQEGLLQAMAEPQPLPDTEQRYLEPFSKGEEQQLKTLLQARLDVAARLAIAPHILLRTEACTEIIRRARLVGWEEAYATSRLAQGWRAKVTESWNRASLGVQED